MSVERIDRVSVECPGCGTAASFDLEDEWVDVENIGSGSTLIESSTLPDIIVDFEDPDVTCFWRNLGCESCGRSSTVVSFLADPSEVTGSKSEVRSRVKRLRREEQVVVLDGS